MTEDVRNVFRGRVLTVNLERVRLPNGRLAELEIAHHPGGATIVAIDQAKRVCMLRQFRHAAGGWLLELPAGKLDDGEPPIDCARRELAEEGGVEAEHWEKLGEFLSSPGVLTEVIHVFLASSLRPVPIQPEDHEVFETTWLPMREALAMARSGEIRDAKTLIGLFWAAARV